MPMHPAPAVAKLREATCSNPFSHIEIQNSGDILLCCQTWLPQSLGNILHVSILDAMQSPKAKRIQASVEDGSFRYCQPSCPYLSRYLHLGEVSSPMLLKSEDRENRRHQNLSVGGSVNLVLNHDLSCNLSCPSCRPHVIMHKGDGSSPLLGKIHAAVLDNIKSLRAAGIEIHLVVTGGGDAFASPTYYSMLKNMEYDPGIHLCLKSNGVLMTETRFTPTIRLMTKSVSVSVDAYKEETYRTVRRGGIFMAMRKNIAWLDQAILAGDFPSLKGFTLNFVVQNENYREMVDFAKWATSHRALEQVNFNLIADWEHQSRSEFSNAAVWWHTHPNYLSFLREAQDPYLRSNPKLHLGDLSKYANPDTAPRPRSLAAKRLLATYENLSLLPKRTKHAASWSLRQLRTREGRHATVQRWRRRLSGVVTGSVSTPK